jgi:hypothetical protein
VLPPATSDLAGRPQGVLCRDWSPLSRGQKRAVPFPSPEFPPGNPSFWGTTWGTIGPFSTDRCPPRPYDTLPVSVASDEAGGS